MYKVGETLLCTRDGANIKTGKYYTIIKIDVENGIWFKDINNIKLGYLHPSSMDGYFNMTERERKFKLERLNKCIK